MFIKIVSFNINGFNKSSSSLANFITKHNIRICCTQETHTVQTHELEHFCRKHNLDGYPNTEQSNTPHIKHRQGTIFIINTKDLHLTPNNSVVSSVVEWLKHRTDDQHSLGSKPTCAILLCPWERHFTALSPGWWS